jgi:arylsulfatase
MLKELLVKTTFLLKAILSTALLCQSVTPVLAVAQPTTRKPNILVIWGDDIGQFNVSAYNNGMMGYKTPNIDQIAKGGALFTDWYGQQSCTAGRAAFITGQSPIRTGLTKVGLPGAPEGMKKEDPTIATLLKARQPLPPQRRGGAGESRLSEESRFQETVRTTGGDSQLR